jgi:hypothetical protein
MRVEKSRSRGVEQKTAERLQEDGETARRGDACVARAPGIRIAGESARDHIIDPAMVEIRPQPSPAERVAILIALEQMLGRPRRDEAPRHSAWAQAGRRESLLSSGFGSRAGWTCDSGRLADR